MKSIEFNKIVIMDKSKILPPIHTTTSLRLIKYLKFWRGLWTNFLTTYPQLQHKKSLANESQNSKLAAHFYYAYNL